jgi:hypothetical protein
MNNEDTLVALIVAAWTVAEKDLSEVYCFVCDGSGGEHTPDCALVTLRGLLEQVTGRKFDNGLWHGLSDSVTEWGEAAT